MPPKTQSSAPYWVMIKEAERRVLEGALRQCGGKSSRAAKMLGISLSMFWRRARAHGIQFADQPAHLIRKRLDLPYPAPERAAPAIKKETLHGEDDGVPEGGRDLVDMGGGGDEGVSDAASGGDPEVEPSAGDPG